MFRGFCLAFRSTYWGWWRGGGGVGGRGTEGSWLLCLFYWSVVCVLSVMVCLLFLFVPMESHVSIIGAVPGYLPYCFPTLRKHAYSNIVKILPPQEIKKNQIKYSDISSYFCSNHRLWVLVRTASSRGF